MPSDEVLEASLKLTREDALYQRVPPPELLDRLLVATSLRDGLEVLARYRYWEGVRKRNGTNSPRA